MNYPPLPKFEKSSHHVVPALWQRRFSAPGDTGPYYLNVVTKQALSAQGPGSKMAEPYANIVFDKYFRPSDSLEDRLSKLETKMVRGLDNLIGTGVLDDATRVDVAMLMAVQASRYPERFADRLDLGKYLAIALGDFRSYPDAKVLNGALRATGMLPGASLTDDELTRLRQADEHDLAQELAEILNLHGYEAHFNPNLVIDAAERVASHLLALQWTLLHSSEPAFILSDRPVPSPVGYGFSIGLSASYGLELSMPQAPVSEGTIHPQTASLSQINAINAEVRGRAREWICGPGSWVHQL